MSMTSRDRLLALLADRYVDRVPISTYGVDRYSSPWIIDDSSYAQVLAASDCYEDIFAKYDPLTTALDVNLSFLAEVLNDPAVAVERHSLRKGASTWYTNVVHTPSGRLTNRVRIDDHMHTWWTVEPYLKSDEDIKRFMSVPYSPLPIEPDFEAVRRKLGDKGVMMMGLPDPICHVAELFDYQDFLVRALTDKRTVEALLQLVWGRLRERLLTMLSAGFGPVFRIYGPEYVTPPMLPPAYFEEFVVKYDSEMIDMIHRPGCYARLHCHGPISKVLDAILSMEPDMIEPCEPPPEGDVALGELIDRVGREVVVMGNIELRELESARSEEIDCRVRRVMDIIHRSDCRFILLPSAAPIVSPLPARTAENLIQFLESGVKYGRIG